MKYKSSFYNVYTTLNGQYFVFNTFSKSKIEVDENLFNQLRSNDIESISKDYIGDLKVNGFIVDDKTSELEILKDSFNRTRSSKETLFITLIPTLMCNFRCSYCFEGSDSKNNTKVIDYNILSKYANKIFPKYNHVHISLFGGEPLLVHQQNIKFLDDVDKLSKDNNFSYTIGVTTNGYLLTDKVISDLIKYHCQTIQITIDGCKTTHNSLRKLVNGKGSYNEVITNFKNLLKYNEDNNLNIMLRVNLLNNSPEEISELLDEFTDKEKDAFSIYFRGIYNTKEFQVKNSNEGNLEKFYTLAQNKGFHINVYNNFSFYHCEGDGTDEQYHICPDLKIYKCTNDMNFEKASIGYIDDGGNLVLNDNLNYWKQNDVFSDSDCIKCKFLPMCWGGCPLYYKKNGKRLCIREKKIMGNEEKGE